MKQKIKTINLTFLNLVIIAITFFLLLLFLTGCLETAIPEITSKEDLTEKITKNIESI